MSADALVAFGLWVFGACTVWYALVYGIPSIQVSRFRYRVWRIRDQIVDDRFSGALPDAESVQFIIGVCEAQIAHAREHTMLKYQVLSRLARRLGRAHEGQLKEDLAKMSPEQRERLTGYLSKLDDAYFKHLLFGSSSGWLFFTLALTVVLVWVAVLLMKRALSGSFGAVRTACKEMMFLLLAGKATKRQQYILAFTPDRRPIEACA